MNSLPGVNEMLALLDALKKNVRDFAAREEKLESDFRVQTAAELRDFASRNQAQESAAVALELNAATALKNEKDQCQSRFERRKAWINPRPRRRQPARAGPNRRAGCRTGKNAPSRACRRRKSGAMRNSPMPPRLTKISSSNWPRPATV